MQKTYFIFLVCFISFSNKHFCQAKFEPPYGAYPGAIVALDAGFNNSITTFEQKTNKKHSVYFSYTGWGQPFPNDWVADYASKNNVVQIAFEPNGGLDEVTDCEYIRDWARNARRSGAMILLRWASEMNGDWVAWYGNPDKYKEKFRLIHDIMAEEAPNVAMVWAPNDIPTETIPLYYPGDAYVDWVGVDFYGVYYYESGTPERKDPRQKLKVVYDVYSAKKPIMICEWAATHYTERVTPPQDCTPYCLAQMDSLYLNIKTQFPRLKAFCWFSVNSLSTNKNDFSLSDNQTVLTHYSQVIQDPYFLSMPYRNIPLVKIGLTEDSVFNNNFSIPLTVICDTVIDSIACYVNNKYYCSSGTSVTALQINVSSLPDNYYMFKIVAYAHSGYTNFETVRIIINKERKYSVMIQDDIPGNNGFNLSGQWNISTSQPDRYGPYYQYSVNGNGSNSASWNYVIGNPGNYNVYACWSAHENRATNTPYVITYKNGSDTLKVNQKTDGGKWNLLGTYYFDNSAKVEVNNNANGIVIADAVKIEWCFVLGVSADKQFSAIDYNLFQNYPNPFNNATNITYYIPEDAKVKVIVYNTLGREVALLCNETKAKGSHRLRFNADKLSSGIYFYRLEAGKYSITKKMILLK